MAKASISPTTPAETRSSMSTCWGKPLVDAAGEKTHDRQMLEQHPLLLAGAVPAASRPADNRLPPRRGARLWGLSMQLSLSTPIVHSP